MDKYNEYAALADTIKIEDITSCKRKRSILQRLKDNDESFDKLWICSEDQVHDDLDYDFDNAVELAWLGYILGSNSTVKELYISSDLTSNSRDVFRRGLGNNKSIYHLTMEGFDLHAGQMLMMLDLFMKNNNNLTEINVNGCQVGAEGIRQLSLAIGNCNKSLNHFSLCDNEITNGQVVEIITALSMHPQLTKLYLSDNAPSNMGRNECTALSTLLRCTTTQLQELILNENNIDDVGVEILVNGLANVNTLQTLNLCSNRSITIKGWKAVATLLKRPNSNLQQLEIYHNNIGDEGALIFANALANNSTLETLDLDYCGITGGGLAPFSKLLCDISSVNETYLSNHTLQYMGDQSSDENVLGSLNINGSGSESNKGQVAMTKIFKHHSHFDMEPFFEWEFKVLPLMINWFANAARRVTRYDQKISRSRLSVTFDFIREFPMLYVEPITRQEIAEYTAMEESLQAGGQMEGEHQGQLEEIRQRKARSMGRL